MNTKNKVKNVKVLFKEPCLEVDGIKYHHHPNGGGLVAETAGIPKTAYIGPFVRVIVKKGARRKPIISAATPLAKNVKVLYKKPCLEIDGVKYDHHLNGGGLVAETAEVSETAYAGPFTLILDKSRVLEKAWVDGFAEISGYVMVYGKAKVTDRAKVSGNARVFGKAKISENAKVSGNAAVFDSATIRGTAHICGCANVYEEYDFSSETVDSKSWPE